MKKKEKFSATYEIKRSYRDKAKKKFSLKCTHESEKKFINFIGKKAVLNSFNL